MARNRIIYQSEAIYVSKNKLSTSEQDHKQLKRIQSADYSFTVPREYINQYGQLGAIDALVTQSPTVSINLSYYLTDLENESNLGFYVRNKKAIYTGLNGVQATRENGYFSGYSVTQDANFISKNLTQESGFNFFIAATSEGTDLNLENTISGKAIIGIGNALINSYSLEAQVGRFPTVNIQAEGLNINSSIYKNYLVAENTQDVGFPNPAVNVENGKPLSLSGSYYNLIKLPTPNSATGDSQITALRPSDIVLSFNNLQDQTITNLGLDTSEINLQSFTLEVNFNRESIQELGYKFVNSRPVGFPIIATLNMNAIVNENQAYNLMKNIDNTSGRSMQISIKNYKKQNEKALSFDLRNFLLRSESFVSNIGQNKNVDLTFEAQFGSNLDLLNGIFASGSFNEDPIPENNLYFNYDLNTGWYNPAAWFEDPTFSTSKNSLPQYSSNVFMYGVSGAFVDIGDSKWITPALIDTRNVIDPSGIYIYSSAEKLFTGIIIGNSTFTGSASPA